MSFKFPPIRVNLPPNQAFPTPNIKKKNLGQKHTIWGVKLPALILTNIIVLLLLLLFDPFLK